jgi:hypothetical protein
MSKRWRGERWSQKVEEIFAEAFGGRGQRLEWPLRTIEAALKKDILYKRKASEIAFHLSDWYLEAAFLACLAMAPKRFTPKDVRAGVTACLIHIPNHIIAAATLAGWEIGDIFHVGAKIKRSRNSTKRKAKTHHPYSEIRARMTPRRRTRNAIAAKKMLAKLSLARTRQRPRGGS